MSTSERRSGIAAGWTLLWVVLAIAGIVVWALTLNGPEPQRAWRALLINFLFFSSLSGGLVVWPAVVRGCNGRWHIGMERLPASGIGFSIPSIVGLIILWLGSAGWSPWYHATYHQGAWLDNSTVFARDLAVLVIFWLLAGYYLLQRRHGQAPAAGYILIVVYTLAFSLLGFDLVMALDPYWPSNLAGGYFFMSGLYIAITCWGLFAAWNPESSPDQRQDIGKLIVAFSLMTIYLMYAHLNLMYYENLPAEVRFLIPRMHNPGWRAVSYFIVFIPYFGPLILLLTIRGKRNRWWLGIVSLLVLGGMWIERWWLVAPTFDKTVRIGLSEFAMAVGCIGLLGLGIGLFQRLLPEGYLREEKEQ
jgi:hypothetical protein